MKTTTREQSVFSGAGSNPARLTRTLTIPASRCDSGSLLSVQDAFLICMDLAGEHAEALGNGIADMMARGLFWAAVKTKLRFFRRPGLMETVTAATWPEPPGRMKQNRDYLLTDRSGAVLLAGKTEWTVLDQAHGSLHPIREGIYDPALVFDSALALPEPFHRFPGGFEGAEDLGTYTVCSTDIDMGRHMNNAAYVRMFAGRFTTAQREAAPVTECEIHYRTACYEGDVLRLQKRRTEDALELRALTDSGETVVLARVR